MRWRRGTLLQSIPPIDQRLLQLQGKQNQFSVSYAITICL